MFILKRRQVNAKIFKLFNFDEFKIFKFITLVDVQIFLLLINLIRIKVQMTTNQMSFLMIDYSTFKSI